MKRLSLLLGLLACADVPTPTSRAWSSRVAVAPGFGCAITPAQRIACWGHVPGRFFEAGEAGDQPTEPMLVDAASDLRFRAVAAGASHACALGESDEVWCWGYGRAGQLGRGGGADSSRVPVRVDLLSGVTQLVAGAEHSCALDRAGAVWCWGRNQWHQLGTGDTIAVAAPVKVRSANVYAGIVAGPEGTCAYTAAGQVDCWGNTALGSFVSASPALAIPGLRQLAVSSAHLCWLTDERGVRCQGRNQLGVLGAGATVPLDAEARAPVQVELPEPAVYVATGQLATCTIGASGRVYCWGLTGPAAVLGVPADTLCRVRAPGSGCVRAPRRVETELQFRELAIGLGERWRCGITSDDRLACWGQMAIEVDEAPRSAPTVIPWPATP